MMVTLPEVVVSSFSLSNSVGRNGFNFVDDLVTIKQLLNGISSANGGAANTLDENDFSISDADFDRMVEAIEIFQARHFTGVFPPDGVVSPEKKTHRKLRELFLLERGRRGVLPLPVLIRPIGPLTGLSNETGFSAEGLVKGGNGEWQTRDLTNPPIQVVPTGEARILQVTTVPGNDIDTVGLSSQILDPSIAQLVGSSDSVIVVQGVSAGTTTLRISAKGLTSDVTIVVRGRRGINMHLTVLGQILPPGQETTLRAAMVRQLNRIFQPQTNQIFFEGVARVVTKLKSISRNTTFDIDPAQKLAVDDTNTLAPSPANPQVAHAVDLLAIDPGARQQFQIFIGNIVDAVVPSAFGSAFAETPGNAIGGKACWFRSDQLGRVAQNSFSTIAHESGHAMGMFHITAPKNERFLMFPFNAPQDNNLIIPAETAVDLGPP